MMSMVDKLRLKHSARLSPPEEVLSNGVPNTSYGAAVKDNDASAIVKSAARKQTNLEDAVIEYKAREKCEAEGTQVTF